MPSSTVAEMAQKVADEELFSFEGSEKKMEIDFVPTDGSDAAYLSRGAGSMRTYRRQFWSECIALLNGSILLAEDQVHPPLITRAPVCTLCRPIGPTLSPPALTPHMPRPPHTLTPAPKGCTRARGAHTFPEQEGFDTYLISESSLFVYDDRVVILTCGTTLLLKTLPVIVQAGADIGLEVKILPPLPLQECGREGGRGLAMAQSMFPPGLCEPGLFPASKLTDLYRELRMST